VTAGTGPPLLDRQRGEPPFPAGTVKVIPVDVNPPVVLASGLAESAEVAVDPDHLSWATGDTIHVANSTAHDLADRVAEGMAASQLVVRGVGGGGPVVGRHRPRPSGLIGVQDPRAVRRRSARCTWTTPRLPWHPMLCRMRFDHPDDHPGDRSGSVGSRLDRRGGQREQARSVWSRSDRRRASGS
jgi:hypothetical protein